MRIGLKTGLTILLLIGCIGIKAQTFTDSSSLVQLYDRCLDFSEEKADSLLYYANYIDSAAKQTNYAFGPVFSLRLNGIYHEIKNDYEKAMVFYLKELDAARNLHNPLYESSALGDLALVYVTLKQPEKAKNMYKAILDLSVTHKDMHSIITNYNNLGAVYNQLNMTDSALFFLTKGLTLANQYKDKFDNSSLINNIGNVYFKKKQYSRALPYFQQNSRTHEVNNKKDDLWISYLNIGDCYIELKSFEAATEYCNKALVLAQELHSKSKESDSYALLSKLYKAKEEYETAYDYQSKWYSLDTSLFNAETNAVIARLQEQYNAAEREKENKLLQSEIEKEKWRRRVFAYIALGAGLVGISIAFALQLKRRANKKLKEVNDIISRQNEKLEELNFEKNALISMVSHDLATPFATIKTWSQVLASEKEHLTEDQQKALTRITQSADKGETLIHRILDIEKAETNRHKMSLENFDLTILVAQIVDDFKPIADKKSIQLHYDMPEQKIFMLSDKYLVGRICENLLSNAIKYTQGGKNVWVSIAEEQDGVHIKVRDEGVGIPKEELSHLFSKYAQISSTPTDGEASTGLGLSIVKRIVDELNGAVFCESEYGKGSLFTVVLKK